MPIIRDKNKPVMVERSFINDEKLSFACKGFFICILANPDDGDMAYRLAGDNIQAANFYDELFRNGYSYVDKKTGLEYFSDIKQNHKENKKG